MSIKRPVRVHEKFNGDKDWAVEIVNADGNLVCFETNSSVPFSRGFKRVKAEFDEIVAALNATPSHDEGLELEALALDVWRSISNAPKNTHPSNDLESNHVVEIQDALTSVRDSERRKGEKCAEALRPFASLLDADDLATLPKGSMVERFFGPDDVETAQKALSALDAPTAPTEEKE